MNQHIVLITSSPQDRWSSLVRSVVGRDADELTVVEPGVVEELLGNQTSNPTTFDLALVDSSTVPEATQIVKRLHSRAAAAQIIVLTSAPGWQQAREVFLAGAHDYRFKSYDVTELQCMMQSVQISRPDEGIDEISDN